MDKSVGIIIIGDEILSGKVTDTNSTFLCKRFRALGVKVKKISTIPDDVAIIAEEITQFSKLYDTVVTSGGVGPTPDDVTYEAVAAAFNTSLTLDQGLKQYFQWYLGKGNNEGLRLVTIPSCAEVLYPELEEPLVPGSKCFPIVKTNNVYNFPGIPDFLQKTFIGLQQEHFKNSKVQFYLRTIYLTVDEICIVNILSEVMRKYKDYVEMGSYPRTTNTAKYENKITIESTSLEHCLEAEKELLMKIPPSWLKYISPKLPDFEFIYRLPTMDNELSKKVRESFEIIANSFSKYEISEMFVGFNGGKDCTVLFNLVYCYCLQNSIKLPLTLVYFKDEYSFPELDQFIDHIKNSYNVELLVLPTPMKSALISYLQNEPKKSACFLGLRNNDPKSEHLKPMEETDGDWPKLMRIFPILHWSYNDVWNFIRCADIPYCSLYNQGYTSLGHKKNTSINSKLKYIDKNGKTYFRPAFLLNEERLEREGR